MSCSRTTCGRTARRRIFPKRDVFPLTAWLSVPSTTILLLTCLWHTLSGQEAPATALELEFLGDQVDGCEGSEIAISINLQNPLSVAVGGFQLFLRFPAEQVEVSGYEPGAVSGIVALNAPPPFGRGYEGCEALSGDPWDDGLGDDVLSVVASVFGEGGGVPVQDGSAVLGTVRFRLREGVEPDQAFFSIGVEGCGPYVGVFSGIFDAAGNTVPMVFKKPFALVEIQQPFVVQNLSCVENPRGTGVLLSWEIPEAGGGLDGYRVRRNGELIRSLVPPFLTSIEDVSAPAGIVTYELHVLQSGEESACSATCRIDRGGGESVEFSRGDANGDGRWDISDPLGVLRFLFGGVDLSCPDAGDFDDDGTLDISDGIALLEFLFKRGDHPAPPFPGPGLDPTPDDLACS